MAAISTITTFFPLDGREGINLNITYSTISSVSNPEYPSQNAKLGDRCQGNAGTEWLFVQASTTVTCYNLVAIDSGYNANDATQAMVTSNVYTYGVAEFPPNQLSGATVSIGNASGGVCNAGDYFWAMMKSNGGAQINALTTAVTGATRVFINVGTPGCISSTASNSYFPGLVIPTSLVTTTVVTPILFASGYLVAVSVTV